nr:class I SAM-dependent methyltransferase [Natronolimnobius sp. AArcel1]
MYYAYYGPNETSDVVRRMLEQFVDQDAPVLELGCSSGRHLAHLHEHGFEDLSGIELNDDALAVMEDAYPGVAGDGEFYLDSIESVIGDFADDQFSAVYSVETLQHLHPDTTWVFDELSRITDEVLITAEIETCEDDDAVEDDDTGVTYVDEGMPLYHRDWEAIFTDREFEAVAVTQEQRDTIRTFRAPSSSDE